jgi:putative endonuclease
MKLKGVPMIEFGYVYILSSGFKHLYIGVTSNLELRVGQHKDGTYPCSFTERYNITQLVYFERFAEMQTAIAREKQLKRWSRIKKIRLIVADNPDWRDLSVEWGSAIEPFSGDIREPSRFGQNTGVSPLRITMKP